MYYHEREIGEIVNSDERLNKHREHPNEAIFDHNQFLKTTNFSINEILRPEFGQRKAENNQDYQQSQNNAASAFSIFDSAGSYSRPFLSFEDIFHRYKTYMCSVPPSETFSIAPPNVSVAPTINGTQVTDSSKPISSPVTPTSSDTGSLDTPWPAWVYCTRYSDRPSAGPRAKKVKARMKTQSEEKRPRTAFSNDQLQKLKQEFNECRYLTEKRRVTLAKELNLTEAQIKIWFQNKRAKLKRTSDTKNTLALNLIAEGLYNHTVHAATKRK